MAIDALFEEIYLCQEKNSKPVGIRFGSFVFAPNLAPVDPCTGAITAKDLDGQIESIFGSIDTFLKSSGLGHDNITRVTFFMSDLTERIKLNPPWGSPYAAVLLVEITYSTSHLRDPSRQEYILRYGES